MMYPRSIYSSAPAKGWLPWGFAAPLIGLALITAPLIVTSLWLERRHYLDRNGDPIGVHGLVALLSLPFLTLGLVILAWALFIERRGLATIGLIRAGAVKGFFGGLLIGVAAVCSVVAMISAAGGYQLIGFANALGDRAALIDIAVLLACFALQSSVEEIVFRGWLLSVITRRWNLVAAVALSSIVFALLHFSPTSTGSSPQTFCCSGCSRVAGP
jgi:membrane protease YdiL (CAAX protease family)